MIKYTLKCDQGHSFESWFQSAAAFDTLKSAGHLACSTCGSSQVEKAIMAPRVRAARDEVSVPKATHVAGQDADVQKSLEEMKRTVEENSDYVGDKFASEARSMHLGDTPERAIYGQANAAEAKSLIEDGIPVLPLPFTPTRKTN
ncbi:MAG: DUF1178 family protein [Paracoccaceae bacterium]